MIPWEHLGRADVPGGGGLELLRRGGEYSIRLDGAELMNSRVHASEDALGTIPCAHVAAREAARVLVGGLGMGYTLRAALLALGPTARVVVAELVPEVVAWNRGPLGPLAGNPLRDARVTVREADVAAVMREEKAGFDAILLDVDNGPEAMTSASNRLLYHASGIRTARAALRPGGLLAVWSAGGNDRAFVRRLEREGFSVEAAPLRARGARGGGHHTVWLATRAG